MEEKTDMLGLLDLMARPGFCTVDHQIIKTNPAARQLLIEAGTDVRTLLESGQEEYTALENGCLCLTLRLPGGTREAAVTRLQNHCIFLMEEEDQGSLFQAMALVSRELRKPLDSAMRMADQLLQSQDPDIRAQSSQLNQGLYQLLRIVGNLSYPASGLSAQETRNVSSILAETVEKAAPMLASRGLQLHYKGLDQDIYCLVDGDLLERAVLNLLSNAAKFTPEGGNVRITLSRKGSRLLLQVQDSGSGIAQQVRSDLFFRYMRQPGIEDGRYGLGLGLHLVRSFAAKHGGTVLVDQPAEGGSRVTVTLAIHQSGVDRFSSPRTFRIDYAGGRDHALVELSDCLGPEYYSESK